MKATNAQTNKHYLIVGLGLTGLSCARFCKRNNLTFSLCDTRKELSNIESINKEFPDHQVTLGDLSVEFLTQFDELLVSPGVSIHTPELLAAANAGVTISGDIQLFSEHCRKPVIAITGSNGKSTVTTLVEFLLQESGIKALAGGNLGTPALDLLAFTAEVDCFVLELSSFQLETTSTLNADVVTILNISPDHMDRYDDLGGYIAAKQRIFIGAKHIVVNKDDQQTYPLNQQDNSSSFAIKATADFALKQTAAGYWLMHGETKLIEANRLSIRGSHNIANVLAALAMIKAFGIELSSVIDSLPNFKGLSHRCEWIAKINDVEFFNDSKGTNVGSTIAAVEGLTSVSKGQLWLLAGGESKGQDFSDLAKACQSAKVAGVMTYGKDRNKLNDALQVATDVMSVETLSEALALAVQHARSGDQILLSPACASFDQFKNYQDRGQFFCDCVEALK
ncbi:MAG: UDP-N-acetylmuramoyl-L-alanine--D-glutamate ligase [Oleibacter sp.]|nr:UDP-N-acetylmuramoyl-L-alanine--D-glutamate ligase [Thalassolituus sp.]